MPREDIKEAEKKADTNPSEAAVTNAKSKDEVTSVAPTVAPDYESSKLYEDRHSYIQIKISISSALNPQIDAQVLPRANNIALKASSNMPLPFPNVVDAVHDF